MNVKKIVTIFLSVFIVLIIVILILGFLSGEKKSNQDINFFSINKNYENKTQQINSPEKELNAAIKKFTTADVSKHNSENDCWVIIDEKIYDVSGFVNNHSGGKEAILYNCGKDGSLFFKTKGKNPPKEHSLMAKEKLKDYYIGDLLK